MHSLFHMGIMYSFHSCSMNSYLFKNRNLAIEIFQAIETCL